MYIFNFEKLSAWKKSRDFTLRIYKLSEKLPDSEKFGLTSQIRRSAVSVCSNIAEGSSRMTPKDQCHFYNMAFSSMMECFNQIIIAGNLSYITEKEVDSIRKDTNIISYMLIRLRDSVK
jgi:four helix bundle protein